MKVKNKISKNKSVLSFIDCPALKIKLSLLVKAETLLFYSINSYSTALYGVS